MAELMTVGIVFGILFLWLGVVLGAGWLARRLLREQKVVSTFYYSQADDVVALSLSLLVLAKVIIGAY